MGWGGVRTPPGFPSLTTHSPGIKDIFRMPCAAVVGDVAILTVKGGWIGQARGQEVGPQLTCGHLGDTGQGEAGQAAEDEGAQLLVDHGHVSAAHEGWRAQLQAPDPNQLSQADLWGRSGWVKGSLLRAGGARREGNPPCFIACGREAVVSHHTSRKMWVFSFHHTHTQMGNFSHPLCLKWARLLSQGIWLPVITRETGGPTSERGRISIYQEKRQGMALAYIRHG